MFYAGDGQVPDWQNYNNNDNVPAGNQKNWGGHLQKK